MLEAAVWNDNIAVLTEALENGFDVNCKNCDGNTLLHIVIQHNSEYECLKLLLENGASTSIMNNKGLKPLHFIQQEDYASTFLNLFKLEKYFNAHDYHGNTLMHILMMKGVDEDTLKEIMLISLEFNAYFRAQNNKGQTPLHIAAGKPWVTEEAINFVLSNIDEFSLLKRDYKGNTFLHNYLKNTDRFDCFCSQQQYLERFDEFKAEELRYDESKPDVLRNILEGKYKCCVNECLKQLVDCRNDILETPFYLYATTDIKTDIYELFLSAGADINCSNINGDTILHNLQSCRDMEDFSSVDFIVCNGIDLNKKNIFLETPLFHIESVCVMELLLENGSDLNAQNKVGKNLLMVFLLAEYDFVHPELIDLLLDYGINLNAEDIYGNTCLHYAAWKNVSKERVCQLISLGAKIKQNEIGELPCTVAEKMLHYDLLDELCICEPGRHTQYRTLKMDAIKIDDLQNAFEIKIGTSGFDVNDLLNVTNIGSVEFTGEAEKVKEAVAEVVNGICQVIGERDELLKNSVFQTGSVGEKTKVGFPDEFDFICLINFIPNVCELDQEQSKNDLGFAYVKLKDEHLGEEYRELFDTDCYLENYLIYLRFVSALRVATQTPSIYTHPNICFCLNEANKNPIDQIPNCKFSIRWTGAVFKDIVIDVDLVPACRMPGWWPLDTNLDSVVGDKEQLKSDGAILLLHSMVDGNYSPQAKLRVSAQAAEKVHMEALPQLARDSYMVSKILCSNKFWPEVELENHYMVPSKYVKSYMLKNCMFHVFKEVLKEADAVTREQSTHPLKDIVVRIFKTLINFAESEHLPTFMFPWQNVFTFPNVLDEALLSRLKVHCMYRKLYAKVILRLLDEDVDFADCDTHPCYT